MDRGRPAGSGCAGVAGTREPGTFAGGGGGGVRAAGWACAEARDAGATSDERSGLIRLKWNGEYNRVEPEPNERLLAVVSSLTH